MQDLLERDRIVTGRSRGLLGHLLETNDLVRVVAGQGGHLGHAGHPADSGVHQPIGHPRGR